MNLSDFVGLKSITRVKIYHYDNEERKIELLLPCLWNIYHALAFCLFFAVLGDV